MFSLVVPVYMNEESVPDLLARLTRLSQSVDGGLEAVIVVDGSPDRSLEHLTDGLSRSRVRSQLLVLSRNFGSFAAILAGLEHARGEYFGVMSADLQEPEDLVLSLRDQVASDRCDVAVGRRGTRADRSGSKMLAAVFWWFYRRFVQPEMPAGGFDVFACNKVFRDHLLTLKERNTTLVGLVCWLGFRRQEVLYARLPRPYGRSAWSLRRRIRYMLDSAFAFSHLPIRLMEFVGVLGLVLAIGLGVAVLNARLQSGVVVPGYTATVLVVIFFGALNLLGIGLLGEYVWRAFENTKGRPPYVVARCLRFDAGGEGA